jgi:hypothetical protein
LRLLWKEDKDALSSALVFVLLFACLY